MDCSYALTQGEMLVAMLLVADLDPDDFKKDRVTASAKSDVIEKARIIREGLNSDQIKHLRIGTGGTV